MPALRLCYKVRMTSYPEECRDMPQKTKFWESFSLNETGSNRCIHPDLTGEKLTEKNGLWRRFMKYIKQFAIIITFSFAGEVLRALLPLPVPASIYGLVLMLLGLVLHIIPLDLVKDTAKFLVEVMPLMFIPTAVGLTESWDKISPIFWKLIIVTAVSTVLVMAISGRVTQFVIRHEKGGDKE